VWVGAIVVAAVPASVGAQEFQVDLEADRLVRFISDAPIEDFDGVTDRIDGYVVLDAARLEEARGGEGTSFYFEVELASLDTGIGLRNRHMRDDYLEIEDHPYATFEGELARIVPSDDGTYALVAEGRFGVHGVSRPLTVPCTGTPRGDGFGVSCAFQVLLSDHDIEIPQVMFLKLADEIRLELDFSVAPPG
jgi:polyisoprenoid-binding protein YceI